MNKGMYQMKYNNWNNPCSCMPGAVLTLIPALYYETLHVIVCQIKNS